MKSTLNSVRDIFRTDPAQYIKNPKKLLVNAARANKETGSSTLVIVSLDQMENKLKTAMIGDSGYMIFRKTDPNTGEYINVFRSEEQQHSFNFPFQIGSHGDNPQRAVEKEHTIEKQDIVLLGTDGLFDNMYDADIQTIVNDYLKENDFNAQELAQKVADRAFELSLNPKYVSPFAEGARKERYYFLGGKSDDITIVVGRVEE